MTNKKGYGKVARGRPDPSVRWSRSLFSKPLFGIILLLMQVSLSFCDESPCRIIVTEKDSGWPVPLVELRTTHQLRMVTDNAGVITIDQPELLGRKTWFDVNGHGYEVKKDGFGMRGVRLKPIPGKTLGVEVERTIMAKRLGRLTGAGIFAESQKLGDEASWQESGIFGCDSIQTAIHQNRQFWIWGDTTLAHYPLGIFHCSGATTPLNPLRSFEPPIRLVYNYFTGPNGKARGVAKMPGDGPTWLMGIVSLPDKTGTMRLVACYSKIKPPLEVYEWGLCSWNDKTEQFEPLRCIWKKSEATPIPPPLPKGHSVFFTDERNRDWVLFGDPFPTLRCLATFEAWQNSSTWEVLDPPNIMSALGDEKKIRPHRGSIAWNDYRNKWITIFTQLGGSSSYLGEIWYAEADTPFGDWSPAIKVLSHDNYTFYNPRIHPELTPPNSPILLFEGTYTKQFAKHPEPTPRYDYNQILYRLDLDDSALAPVREVGD